ncbi:PEP motif putative anchor domain protein [Gemmatirosa kalamazoonensis]|uniref:PEP motif putative anchor domain protein n=1 Tax=Gemmatirosa kalamazoonensis TaxID=861299 RepID=W0RCY0_9BACT|nr:PEP-CTERM sorting domain-containing protein [Gemmatirosa kalamazoonensis]AHG88979.1 PEP motif putative anchor domain protein [Gemmatirosa kalamazoonensis]
MTRPRLTLGTTLLLAAAAGGASIPRTAHAIVGGGFGVPTNSGKFLYDVCDPLGGTLYSCYRTVIRADPKGDVTHIGMTLDYDFSGPGFVFNAALSGLLGPFAVGGSEPPATPGAGVQPLPIFTSLPDVPGTPNPGWALTVTDDGLAVTMDYRNVSGLPVRPGRETNFFVFVFDLVHPVVIDASRSTVTYSTTLVPGATFAELSFTCESGDPSFPTCGSTVPSAAITLDLAAVPEPRSVLLVASGLLALAGVAVRRRR